MEPDDKILDVIDEEEYFDYFCETVKAFWKEKNFAEYTDPVDWVDWVYAYTIADELENWDTEMIAKYLADSTNNISDMTLDEMLTALIQDSNIDYDNLNYKEATKQLIEFMWE